MKMQKSTLPKFDISIFENFDFEKIRSRNSKWKFWLLKNLGSRKIRNRYLKTWNSISISNFGTMNSISKTSQSISLIPFEFRFEIPKFEFSDVENPKILIFASKFKFFFDQNLDFVLGKEDDDDDEPTSTSVLLAGGINSSARGWYLSGEIADDEAEEEEAAAEEEKFLSAVSSAAGVSDISLHLSGSEPGYNLNREDALNKDIQSSLNDLISSICANRTSSPAAKERETPGAQKTPADSSLLAQPASSSADQKLKNRKETSPSRKSSVVSFADEPAARSILCPHSITQPRHTRTRPHLMLNY